MALRYKKLDHREHILLRPSMYVGSVENDETNTWVFDGKMDKRVINIVPALYKIFDEVLTNAIDHSIRTKQSPDPVKNIKIEINQATGVISVFNDGEGIDIVKTDAGIYVPELIFGHLLTGTNYDDDEERVVGGTNGLGSKLANIFSTNFHVETVDAKQSLVYTQVWRDNMQVMSDPVLKKYTKKPFTRVTFHPDYQRFKMDSLTADMYHLMMKRSYDACAMTDTSVNVWLNDVKLEFKTFQNYVDLFLGPKSEHPRVYEKLESGWEVVATYTETLGFEHMSFCNGIWTIRGGKHVDNVSNMICAALADLINKRHKGVSVKGSHVKSYLYLFVKATVVNPTFDSQTKDFLTTPVSKFGGIKADITHAFIEKLYKTGIVEKVMSLMETNETKAVKKTDGKKSSTVQVDKLDDANFAGTAKSKLCTLILTEGLSAKALVIAGMSVIGRDTWGCYPMKGKVMNIRGVSAQKVADNEELTCIKRSLGLETGKTYISTDELRYGRIMILADADVDGIHIRGLLMNYFLTLFPSLVINNDFIFSMLTPIVRVSHGAKLTNFYSIPDYEKWLSSQPVGAKSTSKYLKGLGSSTTKEAIEYFSDMKVIHYVHTETSTAALDLAFDKSQATERKAWLKAYDRSNGLNYKDLDVTYEDFVHKELITFSTADLERSIPSICDGLKVSQRKVMFGCLKRNITEEIKISSLGGIIAQLACYNHGDVSLTGTIVGMCQDFVGSNNINLLQPIGQLGTRIFGGDDAASPRYICTKLFDITKKIFRPEDNAILTYRQDDGESIEPDFYITTLPMCLVNGSVGIATGFSTSIPCYNPLDIMQLIRLKLRSGVAEYSFACSTTQPWYRGYEGAITRDEDGKYTSVGCVVKVSALAARVTDLPVGVWTDVFKQSLDKFVSNQPDVKKYESHYTTRAVNFLIHFSTAEACDAYFLPEANGYTKLQNALKLVSSKSLTTTNIHMFDDAMKIRKYENIQEIVDNFATVRLQYYDLRRVHVVKSIEKSLVYLQAICNFVEDVINETVVVNKKTKEAIAAQLDSLGYPRDDAGAFEYLMKLQVYSFTSEKIIDLKAKIEDAKAQLAMVVKTSSADMWLLEVDELAVAYASFMKDFDVECSETAPLVSKRKGRK